MLFIGRARARAGKHARAADYWERPNLVMEVVSESNRRHDLVTKKNGEYSRAGIPEYWI